MPDSSARSVHKGRRMLLVLVAVFFVPLAAAFVLYYGFGWRPSGGTNHGELLQPVRQLPADLATPLADKWVLAYVSDGACADESCRQSLWLARQTHQLLNKDMSRMARALFATDHCCDRAYLDSEQQGIQVFDVGDADKRAALLAVLPAGDLSHDLIVIDPRGNIVMRFDTRQDPHGLLEDLKKLLNLSHIG